MPKPIMRTGARHPLPNLSRCLGTRSNEAPDFYLQDIKTSFEYIDLYAKLSLILDTVVRSLVKEEKKYLLTYSMELHFTRAQFFQGRAEYKLKFFLKLKMTFFSNMVLFSVETES
jgi:hypothetical protein